MDSRKVKKFVLNNLAYVIFGYAGNIISFAFRTAEGKDVSEKILPALRLFTQLICWLELQLVLR